jgi:quercetin dioxygenase-like cupin family protein
MRRHPVALVALLAVVLLSVVSATVALAATGAEEPVAGPIGGACDRVASGEARRGQDGGLDAGPSVGRRVLARPVAGAIRGRALVVLHGPVSIVLTDEASDGHQVGDLRATSIATTDADGEPIGRLDATLTTTAVDVPAQGDEIRISTLVFSFGEDGRSQVVVGGSAVYPADGPTLAVGAVTTRPIQGGSGRFAGATGSAVSEHLEDGSWRHTLHLQRARAVVVRAMPVPDVRPLERAWPREMGAWRDEDGERGPSRAVGILRAWMRHLGGHDDGLGSPMSVDREQPYRPERREDPRPVEACRGPERREDGERSERSRAGSSSAEPAAIVRDDLGRTVPAAATGQELGLWRYTIPPGSVLEPHTHAGPQIAHVIRGELEYTVISGEGAIVAADGTSTPIGPGTYVLRTGESVIENPDMVHFGANRGRRPVELMAATLYPEGAPIAIPLESPAPSLAPVVSAPSAAPGSSPAPVASPAA